MSATFWNYFWYIASTFLVFAYFILVIFVFADMLRDRTMSGWAKAGWTIFLIILPFPIALVYLIVRGDSMQQREVERQRAMAERADEYIVNAIGKTPADRIAAAKKLFDDGAINEAEYARLKTKVLAGG
ncbi:hypothetical protein JP74_07770 [Devosia sp. 17-2-E-8]|nr:hypothetical protein JP74_07770 [Devosia sp. 17-2-E-8]